MFRLLPRETKFFELLAELSSSMSDGARLLRTIMEDPKDLVTMHEIEKRYILRVLKAVGGSRTEAARILDLDRKTLYRKLDAYGVSAGTTGLVSK